MVIDCLKKLWKIEDANWLSNVKKNVKGSILLQHFDALATADVPSAKSTGPLPITFWLSSATLLRRATGILSRLAFLRRCSLSVLHLERSGNVV